MKPRRFHTTASPIFGLWRPLQDILAERATRRRNIFTVILLCLNVIVWWIAFAAASNSYPFAR